MVPLTHRSLGYSLLSGEGLEIGALNSPAPLPATATAKYFDAMDQTDAIALFPEVPSCDFVKVDILGDLDNDGLLQFSNGSFDFVIINHVLEHVANPVKTIREIFRICRDGGIVILAIPDKNYTFDKMRELTSRDHSWDDYINDTKVSDDLHYESFLRSAAPHVFKEPPENLKIHIELSRKRREHAHVWSSDSFYDFLLFCFKKLEIKAELLCVSTAAQNSIEYYSVWKKIEPS